MASGRPPTAFQLYLAETKAKLRTQHPGVTGLQIQNLALIRWKSPGMDSLRKEELAAAQARVTQLEEVDDYFVLMPGETVLGVTVERIKLAPSLCGRLEGRSRFARLGLMVHITAGFMQPGINNHQVLEISNVSSIPLALHPGTRMCQFIFETCVGEATYSGRFANQIIP